MNKKKTFYMMIIAVVLSLFMIPSTFSIFKNSTDGNSTIALATWNVTLEQNGVNNSLSIVPGLSTANYTLNVKSLSEVDVEYDVVLSNLPTGVSVVMNGNISPTVSGSTATFTNAGTILYSSETKTNTHTLTFSAANNTTPVNNQSVAVNVIAKQVMSN